MYTIETKGENVFVLLKDGEVVGEFLTLEDAEKAKTVAESEPEKSGTWVDDGERVEYPEGTDDYHSGCEKLSGEDRIDALCKFLHDVHGIHVPYEIAPKD